MIEDKLPPFDKDAEESVIASLLIDSEMVNHVNTWLKPSDFFTEQCKYIYEASLEIIESGSSINQITVAHQLKEKGKLDLCGGLSYLSYLVANCPTSVQIVDYGTIVKNLSLRRKTISTGHELQNLGHNESNPKIIIQQIQEKTLKIASEYEQTSLVTPEQWANSQFDYYDAINKAERKPALSTGFERLDFITGGMFPGEYWILGGRPGHGKTTIGVEIAMAACNKATERNCLFVSLEQKKTDLGDRIIAARLNKKVRELRVKQHKEEELDRILSETGYLADNRLFYYGIEKGTKFRETTVDDIFSMANYMKSIYGLDLIVIDYMALLSEKEGDSLYAKTTNISKKLKYMAAIIDVPVLCLSQLNRELERRNIEFKDKRPIMSDLRESGGIEQDADVILFQFRFSKFAGQLDDNETLIEANDPRAELIIAKQRQEDEPNQKISLKWNTLMRRYIDEGR